MKDDDLKRQLRTFSAPQATETARERARHHALIAFREGGEESPHESRRGLAGWALTGLAALVLAGALFWSRQEPAGRVAGGAALLAQVEALFPGQLDAVIEHDGEVQLALAPVPRHVSDQPVVVEFRRHGSTVRVLSYSGCRVCVDLGGRRACFEALLDKSGRVIVAGDDFVSTAEDRGSVGEWKITAAALDRAS
jgi:hypothetical protein